MAPEEVGTPPGETNEGPPPPDPPKQFPWKLAGWIFMALLIGGGLVYEINSDYRILSARIGEKAEEVNKRISEKAESLNDKIHRESTEIRKLVSDNAAEIGIIKEQVSGIKDNTQRMNDKLDRALKIKKHTEVTPGNSQVERP